MTRRNPDITDLDDESRYREVLRLPYEEILPFVLDYVRRRTGLMLFFWAACIIFAGTALNIRINITGYFPFRNILMHTFIGLVILPLISIPVHELLHIIPFLLTGARRIKVGMDLKQYFFYVTAHQHVVNRRQFQVIGLLPFIAVSLIMILAIFIVPGLWQWSFSLFLFVHTTMCAGDFAMLNIFHINRNKNLFTWDDADKKMAYFYEEI
jgi:hypothetical protein